MSKKKTIETFGIDDSEDSLEVTRKGEYLLVLGEVRTKKLTEEEARQWYEEHSWKARITWKTYLRWIKDWQESKGIYAKQKAEKNRKEQMDISKCSRA